MQAERQTTDWQRKVLNLPVLSWVTLDQAKDPVLRHAELWAAWADMQAAFVSWTSKPLLDSTNKVSSGPGTQRPPALPLGSISCGFGSLPDRLVSSLARCSHSAAAAQYGPEPQSWRLCSSAGSGSCALLTMGVQHKGVLCCC